MVAVRSEAPLEWRREAQREVAQLDGVKVEVQQRGDRWEANLVLAGRKRCAFKKGETRAAVIDRALDALAEMDLSRCDRCEDLGRPAYEIKGGVCHACFNGQRRAAIHFALMDRYSEEKAAEENEVVSAWEARNQW